MAWKACCITTALATKSGILRGTVDHQPFAGIAGLGEQRLRAFDVWFEVGKRLRIQVPVTVAGGHGAGGDTGAEDALLDHLVRIDRHAHRAANTRIIQWRAGNIDIG